MDCSKCCFFFHSATVLGPTASLAPAPASDQPVVAEAAEIDSGGGLEKAMEGLELDNKAARDKKQQTLADLAAASSSSSTTTNTFSINRQGRRQRIFQTNNFIIDGAVTAVQQILHM